MSLPPRHVRGTAGGAWRERERKGAFLALGLGAEAVLNGPPLDDDNVDVDDDDDDDDDAARRTPSTRPTRPRLGVQSMAARPRAPSACMQRAAAAAAGGLTFPPMMLLVEPLTPISSGTPTRPGFPSPPIPGRSPSWPLARLRGNSLETHGGVDVPFCTPLLRCAVLCGPPPPPIPHIRRQCPGSKNSNPLFPTCSSPLKAEVHRRPRSLRRHGGIRGWSLKSTPSYRGGW
jgi:hypothetical protein